jgi:hypothetical protein
LTETTSAELLGKITQVFFFPPPVIGKSPI